MIELATEKMSSRRSFQAKQEKGFVTRAGELCNNLVLGII